MLNDITDSAATAVLGSKDQALPLSRQHDDAALSTPAEQTAEPLVNPVVSIDSSGLVVVQFREGNGEVRFQIPSEDVVRAYEELARSGTKLPVEPVAAASAVAAAATAGPADAAQRGRDAQGKPSIEIDA